MQKAGVVIHALAFAKGKHRLSKCGQVVSPEEAVAFNPTCPECKDRSRWPTKDQQRAFDKLK